MQLQRLWPPSRADVAGALSFFHHYHNQWHIRVPLSLSGKCQEKILYAHPLTYVHIGFIGLSQLSTRMCENGACFAEGLRWRLGAGSGGCGPLSLPTRQAVNLRGACGAEPCCIQLRHRALVTFGDSRAGCVPSDAGFSCSLAGIALVTPSRESWLLACR